MSLNCSVQSGLGPNYSSWMSASTKSSSRGILPDISTTSFYEPRERGTAAPASPGDPPRPAGRPGPGVRPCVLSPRVESLGLLRSSPALSEGSSSHCQTPLHPGWVAWPPCQTPAPPRLGSMAWGSACSAMGDLLQPNCSPVQASPTCGV